MTCETRGGRGVGPAVIRYCFPKIWLGMCYSRFVPTGRVSQVISRQGCTAAGGGVRVISNQGPVNRRNNSEVSMYPVTYEVQNPGEGRNRLTAFFRLIVAIPWTIVGYIYGLIAEIAAFIAWFALVFTGRYPDGLYDFVAGYMRFLGRYGGFYYLLTDEWPPFGGGEEPGYPVQVGIAPPKPEYSRMKALFRIIVGIPVMLLAIVQGVILAVCYIISWFSILFTGKISDGL